MKLMNFLILLLLLLSSEVYAEYLMLDPIHRVVNIEDHAVNLTVLPQIEITTSRERLDVNLLLDLDLSDLTNKLTAVILKDATLSARCGKRLTS